MKKAFAMMLALSLAILTGCGAADAEVSPTPVPSPPVQEYAESDPITVTLTPVELSEEEQEIAELSSRISDEVHTYELETEGKITGAVARVFSLEDGAWVHCTAGFAFDLAEDRFSVVTPGLADGATVNFTTPSGVLSSAGVPGFEPPDAGSYLYGALGRSVTAQTGQNIPVAVQVFGTYDPETDSGEVVSADPEGFYNPEVFEGMDGVYVLCLCFLSEENPPLAQ